MYGPGLMVMEELAGLVAIDLFTTLQATVSPRPVTSCQCQWGRDKDLSLSSCHLLRSQPSSSRFLIPKRINCRSCTLKMGSKQWTLELYHFHFSLTGVSNWVRSGSRVKFLCNWLLWSVTTLWWVRYEKKFMLSSEWDREVKKNAKPDYHCAETYQPSVQKKLSIGPIKPFSKLVYYVTNGCFVNLQGGASENGSPSLLPVFPLFSLSHISAQFKCVIGSSSLETIAGFETD